MAVYFESYPNIYRFMSAIDSRPNNDKFGNSSTRERSDDWAGTHTYQEAVEQFSHGLPEVCDNIKTALAQFKARSNIVSTKSIPHNHYYGHVPNVAAAIIGLPKSMRHRERIPQKTKTIGLLWDCCQNCGVDAETLQKSGEAVLQLVWALEMRGYRVNLDCAPFTGTDSGREFLVVINLKQYGQHMDLLKLSFPVTSPAMFRRFGFKWAETLPGVKGGSIFSYGSHLSKSATLEALKANGYDTKSIYCIDVNDCEENEFNPIAIAKSLGIII